MLSKKMMLSMMAGVLLYSCAVSHKTSQKKNVLPISASTTTASADTTKKSVSKVKPYKEVITAKAVTETGLFKVHKVEDRYYFEIPDSLLDRDMLIVNRIIKGAVGDKVRGFGYGGDEISEFVIQFSKGPNNKVFIKQILNFEQSKDSSENGMYRAVLNSNLQPIVTAFDIKALGPDSLSTVLDVTDFINSDNDLLSFDKAGKILTSIAGIQTDKSYTEKIRSFPLNIEIRAIKTYGANKANEASSKTFLLNNSIILLPLKPMNARKFDKRVGYFTENYLDFDANPQGVEYGKIITRWRLEPKDEDREKYKRGVLVEPKKPIVFYIDPATPQKWIPYLIQGINDWQKTFEKAGFKNAIYGLEAPKNDSTWSLEDATHSAIIYKASDMPNASGPQVHDPRSGEILESHVNWYHNVMELIQAWYMIQAGPNDPKARKMLFDDSLMGELIRFVSSHEIGHTLGLRHNFGASSTIPVDSLRSKKYVEANGFCPSIMDYARFNYVAQPEDNISEKGIFPRIGVYDEWAIEWGYRLFPELKSSTEENNYLNKWIIEKTTKDKRLWFGSEETSSDPRCQSEDVGDNAVKASIYGIQNLKRIMPHLTEWTYESGKDYFQLYKIDYLVWDQFRRYMFHVAKSIGGRNYNPRTMDEPGALFKFVPRDQQKEALNFLQQQLFNPPVWLTNQKIFSLTGFGSTNNILDFLQVPMLSLLLSSSELEAFSYAQFYEPDQAYKVSEFLADLKRGIWSELKDNEPITVYRRNLQKFYAHRLVLLLSPPKPGPDAVGDHVRDFFQYPPYTDVSTLIIAQINELIKEIDKVLPHYKDLNSKMHLIDVRYRMKLALKENEGLNNPLLFKLEKNSIDEFKDHFIMKGVDKKDNDELGCW